MEKFFALLIGLLMLPSCSSDFDVTAPWQEITVVYGLLNQNDTQHYLKINKAFLSDNNALEVATIADSLYHGGTEDTPVSAVLEEYRGTLENDEGDIIGLSLNNTIPLTRINAADVGIEKEEGTFASDPYYLYTTDYALKSYDPEGNSETDYMYKLVINTALGNEVHAETPIVSDFEITFPSANNPLNFLANTYRLRWDPAIHAAIYDIDMYIRFEEERMIDGALVTELVNLKWDLISNIVGNEYLQNGRLECEMSTEAFFLYLAQQLTPSTDNVNKRTFVDLSFVIHAASESFKIFNEVSQSQFGIASNQAATNTYTNVENGLGLLASRYAKTLENIRLNVASIDELACGEITGHLKFEPASSDPCN